MIEPTDRAGHCKPAYRKALVCLIALHLLAVVAEPLFFFSRSDFQAGPEFLGLRRWLAPYVDWMYLDHGYFFFAPNPGPNHLVAVQQRSRDTARPAGLQSDAFVFPDRKEQWPRLLYHRYFMLAEFYNNSFAPTDLVEQDKSDAAFVERWKSDRVFYESLQRSIRNSVSGYSEGLSQTDSLEILRMERPLPSPQEVLQDSNRLGDSRGLIVLPEGPEPIVPPSVLGVP